MASKRRVSYRVFEEDKALSRVEDRNATSKELVEPLPHSLVRLPYLIMRRIEKSIENGGYLSENLFMPKLAWTLYNMKFPGYEAKLSSFQDVFSLVSRVHFLTIDDSTKSLDKTHEILSHTVEEFINIQNQLSKPFPYIREVDDSSSSNEKSKGITSMMSMFKKNVQKYAGMSISRYNALPTNISKDEVVVYTTLLSSLCRHCQKFDELFEYYEELLDILDYQIRHTSTTNSTTPTNISSIATTTNNVITTGSKNNPILIKLYSNPLILSSHTYTSRITKHLNDSSTNNAESSTNASKTTNESLNAKCMTLSLSDKQTKLEKIWNIVLDLEKISQFLSAVVCEIMLRDTEIFALYYLQTMNEAFNRIDERDILDMTTQDSVIPTFNTSTATTSKTTITTATTATTTTSPNMNASISPIKSVTKDESSSLLSSSTSTTAAMTNVAVNTTTNTAIIATTTIDDVSIDEKTSISNPSLHSAVSAVSAVSRVSTDCSNTTTTTTNLFDESKDATNTPVTTSFTATATATITSNNNNNDDDDDESIVRNVDTWTPTNLKTDNINTIVTTVEDTITHDVINHSDNNMNVIIP